jgi:cell division initiation protein
MLTPVDLETTVFRRGFRGYKTKEVQEFMERLTVDFEHLYKDNIEMKEEKEKLLAQLAQYQQIEETLRNTMVIAQQTADDVKTASQKQGELILREAQHRADQIRARVREEIQSELQQLAELKQQSELFRYQFKKFIEGMSAMVDRQTEAGDLWEKLQQNIAMNPSPSTVTSTEQETAVTGRTNPALVKAVFDGKEENGPNDGTSPVSTSPQI